MTIIDITGPVFDNMWSYGPPLKPFMLSKQSITHAGETYRIDVFDGMSANTGTYIEATGAASPHPLDEIPPETLIEREAYVLQVPLQELKVRDGRPYVSAADIMRAKRGEIGEGAAILISTGYGKNWRRPDYMERCWFMEKEAMEHIVSWRPFLVGGDSPNWENGVHPGGVFEPFVKSKALMLSSCIALEEVKRFKVKLTVLFPRIEGLRANCPCRAVILED